MNQDKPTVTPIEKEDLANLTFPVDEILKDAEERQNRSRALHKATSLGNLEKQKVRIIFADREGIKEVFTTIWAVTDQKVVFKGGRIIPVNRIVKVSFS